MNFQMFNYGFCVRRILLFFHMLVRLSVRGVTSYLFSFVSYNILQHSLRVDLKGQTVIGMELLLLVLFLSSVQPATWKPDFLLEYIDKFEGHSVTLVTSNRGSGLSDKHIRQVI